MQKKNDAQPTLYLALEPLEHFDTMNLLLCNESPYDVAFHLSLRVGETVFLEEQEVVPAGTDHPMGSMPRDLINDRPRLALSGYRLATDGAQLTFEARRRLKARTFFGPPPYDDRRQRHLFRVRLLDPRALDGPSAAGEDLATYTRRNLRRRPGQARPAPSIDLERAAGFPRSIDLHAEQAIPGWERLAPAEILPAQLRLFERYLADAIRFGQRRVTIIHGKGEGRLREAIARRLAGMPGVASFQAAHDHGSTEVFLD